MRYDKKQYENFDEFEREELMKLDGATVDEMIDASFGDRMDFSVTEACWFDGDDQ